MIYTLQGLKFAFVDRKKKAAAEAAALKKEEERKEAYQKMLQECQEDKKLGDMVADSVVEAQSDDKLLKTDYKPVDK